MNLPKKTLLALAALVAGLHPVGGRAAEPRDPALQAGREAPPASAAAPPEVDRRVASAGSPPAAAAPAGAPADPGASAVTLDDLNGLRSDLEQFKYQYGREREYNTTLSTRPVAFSGTIQARFGYRDDVAAPVLGQPNGAIASNATRSSFTNGGVSLQFAGNLFKDYQDGRNLTYLLRAAAAATGGVNLQFASLTYNLRPTLSPEDARLTVQVGQQLVPFGLDVAAPDELKPTISGAQFAVLFPNAVDLGALVRAEAGVQLDYGYSYRAPILAVTAAVLNGSGVNRADDNDDKDLFARAVVTVPAEYNSWLRQLAFGASGYKGRQNTSLANAGAALSGKGRKDRVGFDVYYNHHPFGVTYEFVRGYDGRTYGTTLDAKNLETVRSEGHVVTVYYTFGEQFLYGQSALGTASISTGRFDDWWPKSLQPFVRADVFDPSKGKHDAAHGFRREAYTAGLNAFFAQTTKFQLNLNLLRDGNPSSPTREVRQVLGQLQFGF